MKRQPPLQANYTPVNFTHTGNPTTEANITTFERQIKSSIKKIQIAEDDLSKIMPRIVYLKDVINFGEIVRTRKGIFLKRIPLTSKQQNDYPKEL